MHWQWHALELGSGRPCAPCSNFPTISLSFKRSPSTVRHMSDSTMGVSPEREAIPAARTSNAPVSASKSCENLVTIGDATWSCSDQSDAQQYKAPYGTVRGSRCWHLCDSHILSLARSLVRACVARYGRCCSCAATLAAANPAPITACRCPAKLETSSLSAGPPASGRQSTDWSNCRAGRTFTRTCRSGDMRAFMRGLLARGPAVSALQGTIGRGNASDRLCQIVYSQAILDDTDPKSKRLKKKLDGCVRCTSGLLDQHPCPTTPPPSQCVSSCFCRRPLLSLATSSSCHSYSAALLPNPLAGPCPQAVWHAPRGDEAVRSPERV